MKKTFPNKKTILNLSVTKMYEIVEKTGKGETEETPENFAKLLSISANKTNLWAAIHMSEKLSVGPKIKKMALDNVQNAAEGDDPDALGYRFWLEDWNEKNRRKQG